MSKSEYAELDQAAQAMNQGSGGFTLTGVLFFLGSNAVGDKTYYNFKVGRYSFSMSGKSGQWAAEHDMKVCTVTGAIYPQSEGFSCKLYANNVFPCVRS